MRPTKYVRAVALLATVAVPLSAVASTPRQGSLSSRISPSYRVLRGEGIIITLSDRFGLVPQTLAEPVPGLVRDADVLSLVNQLRSAGALGITVGGVRLTAGSTIRGAGTHLLVDQNPVSVPVRIEAVGNAARLKARLEARGSVVDSFKATGPSAQVRIAQKLLLKAVVPSAPTKSQKLPADKCV